LDEQETKIKSTLGGFLRWILAGFRWV